MPEFQGQALFSSLIRLAFNVVFWRETGGLFDTWGGVGYDSCATLTEPAFQDVFYKQNWASNVKLISYYMLYG